MLIEKIRFSILNKFLPIFSDNSPSLFQNIKTYYDVIQVHHISQNLEFILLLH